MAFTVKHLIEELSCYEEDQIVWVSMDNHFVPVRTVDLDDELDGEKEAIVLK